MTSTPTLTLPITSGWESFKNTRYNGKKAVIDDTFLEKYPVSDIGGALKFDFLPPIQASEASEEGDVSTAVVNSVSELIKAPYGPYTDRIRTRI